MKYNNQIHKVENIKGISLNIKADNLLKLEEMLILSLNQVKEQLDYRLDADTKLSTREVLEMNRT